MAEAPEFECKLAEDDWKDATWVCGCWTHEKAARCFAEDAYMSDPEDTFVVDCRDYNNHEDVKRFSISAEQVVQFTSEEIEIEAPRQGKE